ncbi:MAG TPA: hydroxyisourate hydrolase [Candidatus Binatia bacterium]|jgi:5-hydroxyisourate hydrolase|nr:hydroxyisourate hydrolase [Candidatus Binatia bacterium]
MKRISTHILDLARGKPASGVAVQLERLESGSWRLLNSTSTDQDGRCAQLLASDELAPGVYRLRFDTTAYFSGLRIETLYPSVEVMIQVREGESQFHIPLLLNANGYTTYRGT